MVSFEKTKAKLTVKLGRPPTDAEVEVYRAKKAAKKAKAAALEAGERAAAAAPPADDPPAAAPPDAASKKRKKAKAAAAPAAPVAAPAAAAAPSSKKRKQREPSSSSQPLAQPTAASHALVPSQSMAVTVLSTSRTTALAASAAMNGANEAMSDAAFTAAWDEHRTQALALIDDSMRPPSMNVNDWDTLKRELSATLAHALTPGEDMVAACNKKKAAAAAAKKPKKPKQAQDKSPGRKLKVKSDVLQSALEKMKVFDFDLFDASQHTGNKYLSSAELRQLSIYKGVFDPEKSTKMSMVGVLTANGSFDAEKKNATDEVVTAEDEETMSE